MGWTKAPARKPRNEVRSLRPAHSVPFSLHMCPARTSHPAAVRMRGEASEYKNVRVAWLTPITSDLEGLRRMASQTPPPVPGTGSRGSRLCILFKINCSLYVASCCARESLSRSFKM